MMHNQYTLRTQPVHRRCISDGIAQWLKLKGSKQLIASSLEKLCYLIAACVFCAPTISSAETAIVFELSDGRSVSPFDDFRECDVCPEMIVMPLGSFMMGAIPGESRNPFDFYGEGATGTKRGPDEINIIPNEHPRHLVEIDIPFAIGRNEVTHAEWMACVNDGGCSHNPDHRALTFEHGYVEMGPDHPAVNVSFLDAQEYVAWLNEKVGAEVYRFPTEAEWEYAARAGTETRFAQGDELTDRQANFSGDATENVRGASMPHLANRDMPVAVHELDAANGWGLRHMSGNVNEVTLSCYTERLLGLPTSSAYLAHALAHESCRRVAKGGDFGTAMDTVRLAGRHRPTEDYRRDFYGFRLIRTFAD